MTEKDPLQPIEGETPIAFKAFTDYCQMGVDRSIRGLHASYVEEKRKYGEACRLHGGKAGAKKAKITLPELPPTTRLNTMFLWSSAYDWQGRIRNYDLAHAIEREKRKVRQVVETEDRHLSLSQGLMNIAIKAVNLAQTSQELPALLLKRPDLFVRWVESVVKLQRITLGIDSKTGLKDLDMIRSLSDRDDEVLSQIGGRPQHGHELREDDPKFMAEVIGHLMTLQKQAQPEAAKEDEDDDE